jgi:hypothetical protein
VVVEVLGQRAAGEAVDGRGEAAREVAVAEMLANGGTVFGFDQGVIVGVASAGLGLLDPEFLQEFGDPVVDVLGPVIAVETANREGKGRDELLHNRQEKMLANPLHRIDHLELGDFINRVDQVPALDLLQVALVYGVDPQVAGSAVRSGLAALADGAPHRPGFVDMTAPGSVGLRLAQVVQMAIGDCGQPLEAGLTVDVIQALAELPRGGS